MFEPNIKIWTPEEMEEKRRQLGLLGVKLNNKKFYCSQKLADSCKHFFYDVPKAGKCGTDDDSKHYIQIFTINQELLHKLAARSADAAFRKFLQACYDSVCEIHAKRLAASKAALQADQDNSKKCQNEAEELRKEQSSRSADRLLQQNQKAKKTMPAFDKGDFKTWSSLSFEDAQDSKDRLTTKKTELLQKVNDIEKQNAKFTSEQEAFQKEVTALKVKLNAAKNESEYKNLRLSYDYNKLQVEKLEKEIGKNNEKKADIQAELEGIEKQISVLNCVLDHQNLLHEVKNFHDRKTRVVERMRKILQDRDALNAMRENLNKLWQELTKPEEPGKKRINIFSQDKPVKPEELCEAQCLKASGKIYFI